MLQCQCIINRTGDNYSVTTERLWQYHKDEQNNPKTDSNSQLMLMIRVL